MLFDITTRRWDEELCDLLHVPIEALPDVVPSSGRIGVTSARCGVPAGIPVSGVAGDQQAALFGQACFEPGMAKNTYGTGSFVLLNVGAVVSAAGRRPADDDRLDPGRRDRGLRPRGFDLLDRLGVQWLRDGLGVISEAAEVGPLAASVADSGGVYVVPAFTGLGSPWWDPYARDDGRHHPRHDPSPPRPGRDRIDGVPDPRCRRGDGAGQRTAAARAAGRRWRVGDGRPVADPGRSARATVQRPREPETTAIGAAYLAALAEGVLPDLAAVAASWQLDASFDPTPDRATADAAHATWLRAVERSRAWESSPS